MTLTAVQHWDLSMHATDRIGFKGAIFTHSFVPAAGVRR